MDEGSQPLIVVIILLVLAMYFAVCETALSSSSKSKIKTAADRGDYRAKNVLKLMENFDKAITSLLIYTNIIHISIASIVTVYVTRKWGLSFVSLSTIVTTIVVFFIGEMVPKSIAKKNSERCIISCASSLLFFMKICAPFSAVLASIGNLASNMTKTEPEITVTEDELYDIIENLTEEGAIDEEQGDLFSSALMFSDITIDSIITPRVDMVAIEIDDDIESIVDLVVKTNHSRIPVYQRTTDNIVGILQIRKFMKAYLEDKNIQDIRPLLDQPYFAVSSISIAELLEKMTQEKESLAIIADNYGGTLGLVTVEDILEELVGEIWDEDDKVEEPIVMVSENECIADAEEIVGDVFDEIGVTIEDEDEEEIFENMLVGEWIYNQFTEIPEVNESFMYHNVKVTITEMDKNRILHARFSVVESKEKGGDEE